MIPAFNTVLVVTDFSDLANLAVPYAFGMTAPEGRVHLLHIIEHSVMPSPLYAHYSEDELALPENQEKAKAEVETQLKELVPEDAGGRRASVQAIMHANVPLGILEAAKKEGADAIVIASHGRTGLGHLLLGSVAEEVVHDSPVPVLIVPHALLG